MDNDTLQLLSCIEGIDIADEGISNIIKAFNDANVIIVNAQYIYGDPEIIEQRIGVVV